MDNRNSHSVLYLNFEQGVLSLKLNDTELFRQGINLPSQIVLSLDESSGLSASCSSNTINGITKSACVINSNQKIRF